MSGRDHQRREEGQAVAENWVELLSSRLTTRDFDVAALRVASRRVYVRRTYCALNIPDWTRLKAFLLVSGPRRIVLYQSCQSWKCENVRVPQVEEMRQRLEEKNRMIEKKTQVAMQAQQERNRMNTELTEIKDHMDIKDRKINVLQRKVSFLSLFTSPELLPCLNFFLAEVAIFEGLRLFSYSFRLLSSTFVRFPTI